MYRYAITHTKEDGSSGSYTVELPSQASEVTLLQWSRLQAIAPPIELQGKSSEEEFTIPDWFSFMGYVHRVLTEVFGVPPDVIPGIEYDSHDIVGSDGVIAMFVQTLNAIRSYEPKHRETFTHRGVRYCFPVNVQQSFGQLLIGGKMSMGQAADALQLEQVLSAKGEDGKDVMPEQGYHKDIAIVAALSRRIEPGGVAEKWPLDFIERRAILDERMAAFADLPMDIALDGCFFLSSLRLGLASTLLSALRLRTSLQMLQSRLQSRRTATSGIHGAGTP